MGIVIPGLRGLGAKDRTPEEQKEIQDINNMIADSANDSTGINNSNPLTDSINFDTSHMYGFSSEVPIDKSFDNEAAQMSLEQYFGRLSDELIEKRKKDDVYYSSIDELRNTTHSGMNVNSKYTEEIKNIAENVSPYYRKFRRTDYLTLTDAEWNELAAQYAGMYNAYGEEEANKQLNQSIKDNVAENQPTLQKAWYALAGMGADAAGSMISGAGMLYGLANAITGNYEKNPYLNGAENFLNQIVDNDVTRYGSDIVKYGTILKLDEARELGIPETEIINTAEQDQQLLSLNTPFELIQQGGFTVASMLTAAGASKINDLMFRGFKKGAMGTVMNTSGNIAKGKKVIENIRKVENFNNRYIVPGIVGSVEGVVEGLETKRNLEEEGYDAAYAEQRDAVEQKVLEKLKGYTEVRKNNESMPEYYDANGNRVDIDALYNTTWDEMQPMLDASLANVDAMAAKAGVGNFLANSVINGFLNATFKAGLESERVQEALRKGKLTGWAFANERMNVSGTMGNARVTPRVTALGKIWSYAKEPAGEFSEEYMQTLSDSFFSGMAEHNIHSFIDNKYNGEAQKAIGDATSEDWAAAWTELERNLVSKESMKSGVYGALSSIVGTPTLGRRTNKLDEKGNVILKKDKQGNVITDKYGKPVAEKTLFGRGQSADGDRETGWEAFQRWIPWRSGLTANIREVNERLDASREQAKALEDWLNNPKNKGKFDGLVGSLSWSRELGQSAANGNEFSYRNSKLGKMINDIFMLQKTEGSELYESIMDQLSEVATMQRGSDMANRYVQAIRDNVNTQDPNKTNDEIFDELKNNANDILDMMAKVKQESSKLEKLLGDLDDDTKQSLIFGQLSIDDWKKRKEKLDSEIAEIRATNSREASSKLTDKQKALIATYGSLDNAKKMQQNLKEAIEETTKEVERILARPAKSRTGKEKSRLAYLKAYHNTLKKELDKLKPVNEIPEDANLTLNEEEIMSLDPVSRAKFLMKAKSQLYKKLYESTGDESKADAEEKPNGITAEQKAVIDNLVEQGMAADKDFLSKVIDAGKLQSSMNTFMKQYNAVLMSPQGLRSYAARAKQQAADQLIKERAQELGKIQNYTEFVAAITNALNSGTSHDASIIGSTLRDNENYKKFVEQGEVIESLMKTLDKTDKFKDMDGNTVDLLAQTAYYLYSEGVDLNDTNAVWDALTATDEKGYNKFVSFVDAENQGLDVSQQTRFTSLEEVFQTYKDVLSQAQYDKAQQEKIKKPIEVTDKVEQSDPTPSPTPQKPQGMGIFGSGTLATSPEEMDKVKPDEIDYGEKPKTETPASSATNPLQQASQDENPTTTTTTTTPAAKSKEQPTNFVAKIRNILEGNSKIKNHEKGAEIANSIMDNMSAEDLESYENLQVAVERETKKLLAADDNDDNQMAVSLLKQALFAANPNNPLNAEGGRRAKTDAVQISSINLDKVRQQHPNSPLLPFADKYGIKTYLASGALDRGKDVFFVTDEELTNEVKASMSDYDNGKQLPIIAVVEDENGTYEIDGKKYQPIAIMPATGNPYNQGSDRMGDIRKLAETSGRKLVMYNGKPLKSKTYGSKGVKATPADDHTTEVNNTVDLILDLINSPEERVRAKSQSPQERSKNPWYIRVRDAFMKMLDVSVVNGSKMMSYTQPNNKDGGSQSIYMRIKHIDEYVSPNTGETLLDAVNSGDNNAIVDFNSRTRGVARKIDKFLKSIPSAQDAGVGSLDEIIGKAEALQRDISDYLAPTREGSDFKYVIEPADARISEANGEATFVLSAESKNGDKIQLATFSKNSTATDVAASIIKNLTTEDGDWRRIDGNMLAHWQVDFRDVNKMHNGDGQAKKNIAELIDDDIFDMRATSLTYNDMQVMIESPFKSDNTPRYPYSTNNDNADTSPTNGQPVVGTDQTKTSDGTIVDANSGTVLQGSPKATTNSAYERAKEIAERIVEDSRTFELTSDEKGYVNTKTGRVYNRVTSMISADENGSRFDESSGYGLPSTNIGNAVDEFVRDFFAGTLKKNADGSFNYPNASQKQWESFIKELENLDNIFKAKGITIVPKDVRVTGTIQISDDEGKTYNVDVAGTLDLLGYDKEGNFYIFDMKTLHNSSFYDKKDKWSLQTSLYEKFLKDKYGIDVKNRFIIPIKVEYDNPSKVSYTQGEGNQLVADGKPFDKAEPKLLNNGLFRVEYREPKIRWDKLTAEEQAAIQGTTVESGESELASGIADLAANGGTEDGSSMEGNPVEASVPTSSTPHVDPLTGVTTDDNVFGGLFGDSMFEGPMENPGNVNTPVRGKIPYNSLTQKQKDILAKAGYTEEAYNKTDTQEEIDHINDCLGLV